MLNDINRNEAFRTAIKKKIELGYNVVLDIGTGTGLLSLFCLEGKASEIYACDSSETMIEIAQKVFKENNGADIKIINKKSSELLIPSDIPKRVSLVVTEIFDAGLLGEGILKTLLHAWENLLLPSKNSLNSNKSTNNFGIVVPYAANIHAVGIECDYIRDQLYPKLPEPFLPFEKNYAFQDCTKYDTLDLKLVAFKPLTDIKKIDEINFNDPQFIRNILNGNHNHEVKFFCTKSGRLDCFAVWFDLQLDEDIVLSTGPQRKSNEAWDQAIFALPCFLFIEENQEISINVSFDKEILNIKYHGEWNNLIKPSKAVIKVINNSELVKTLIKVKQNLITTFNHPVSILDWFPFPIFGLSFLLNRKKCYKDKLTCFVPSEKDRDFVNFLVLKHGLEKQVTVEIENRIENYLIGDNKFDIIILNFIKTTGEINETCVSQLGNIKSLLSPCGILLPEKVELLGQLIHSDWLLKASKVISDHVTCGYNIGKHINDYQVHHFIDLDLAIEKTYLSDPVEILCINDQETILKKKIMCYCNSLSPSAMIYWFKIKFLENVDEITTNSKNSKFKQCVFLFSDVKIFQEVSFIIICRDGLLDVKLI